MARISPRRQGYPISQAATKCAPYKSRVSLRRSYSYTTTATTAISPRIPHQATIPSTSDYRLRNRSASPTDHSTSATSDKGRTARFEGDDDKFIARKVRLPILEAPQKPLKPGSHHALLHRGEMRAWKGYEYQSARRAKVPYERHSNLYEDAHNPASTHQPAPDLGEGALQIDFLLLYINRAKLYLNNRNPDHIKRLKRQYYEAVANALLSHKEIELNRVVGSLKIQEAITIVKRLMENNWLWINPSHTAAAKEHEGPLPFGTFLSKRVCLCRNAAIGNRPDKMMKCMSKDCEVGQFHTDCVNIRVGRRRWICRKCSQADKRTEDDNNGDEEAEDESDEGDEDESDDADKDEDDECDNESSDNDTNTNGSGQSNPSGHRRVNGV